MARAKRRRCRHCGDLLPADARANQKFCDSECRRGTKMLGAGLEPGAVAAATEEALTAAGDQLTKKDAGAIAALRFLARKIDTEDELREAALRYIDEELEGKGKPPPVDNVSVPTYLKYCEALGLTPASRAALEAKTGGESGGSNQGKAGALSGIRGAVPRPDRSA